MVWDQELRALIQYICDSMVTTEKFNELIKQMDEKDEKIKALEGNVKFLENQNVLLERHMDDLESYGRRQNLRIIGIPPPRPGTRETSEEVT